MNIVWQRPDGGLSVTEIGAKQTLELVMSKNPGISEENAKAILATLLAKWPETSQQHAQQLLSMPEYSGWTPVGHDCIPPTDRTFRDAWEMKNGAVEPNLVKSRVIAHDKRRKSRAKEFAPLDIEATIPAKAAQAESARQVIRDKDASIQSQIDSASDVQTLKAIVGALP